MTKKLTTEPRTLGSDAVLSYLKKNPNFFIENEEILRAIKIPHQSGQAISLVERQISVLRDYSKTADERFSELITNATNNDQLFQLVRILVLQILQSDHISSIPKLVKSQFENIKNIDTCSVILTDFSLKSSNENLRIVSSNSLKENFSDIFRLKKTFCGAITQKKKTYLFDETGSSENLIRNDIQEAKRKSNEAVIKKIQSTAICPIINNNEILGLIACGSKVENHFSPTQETIFIDFIGEVIGAVLTKNVT
ncbi:DUF484 family protein [OM182 bacterium]|nr:DUF484 family protein [OM182 bacterium]